MNAIADEAPATETKSFGFRRGLVRLGTILAAGTALSSTLTQYVAYRLNYHPDLGTPLAGVLYPPWGWLTWGGEPWAADVQGLFGQVHLAAMAAGAAAFGIALLVSTSRLSPRRYNDIYGTARFATPKDMRASGFLHQKHGVFIGGWTDPKSGIQHYLRHGGAEHVAAIAPTRSGKGVGLVVPTLLSWNGSAVVYDEKGELFHLSSGWRHQEAGNVIFRWQPGSPTDSCSFNFLDTVRTGSVHEVSDAQNIAMMICDPDGMGLKDHWDKTSYALITGVILHECYKAKAKGRTASLPDVADALSDPTRPADALYEEMVNNKHVTEIDPDTGEVFQVSHTFVAQEGRAQLNREPKERTAVHSSAVTAMGLFRDPVVNNNSRTSDFHISDLMNHDRPVTLYIVVPGPDKLRLRPLVRLMITTIINGLTGVTIHHDDNGMPIMPHARRLLLMLDEFPSLGRLRALESAMATIAGFGLKAYLIMQDRQQLVSAYGDKETILSNCHIQVAYAPNRFETAQWISGILGKYTANIEDVSQSGKRSFMGNVSRSIRQVAKDLMTPEQVMSMTGPAKVGDRIVSSGEMLVWSAGMKARIKGTQVLYFNDPILLKRSRIPAPTEKESIRNQQVEPFTA